MLQPLEVTSASLQLGACGERIYSTEMREASLQHGKCVGVRVEQ